MRFFPIILSVLVFLILHSSKYSMAEATDLNRFSKLSNYSPSDKVIDKAFSGILNGYTHGEDVNNVEEEEPHNQTNFANNMTIVANEPAKNEGPVYLDFPIMAKIDNDLLASMLPTEYSVFDLPSRDNAPINRYNSSIKTGNSFEGGNTDFVSSALFNFIFSALTQNKFSMNFSLLALKDNPQSVNMNIILTPVENVILKYSRTEEGKNDVSLFEIKIAQDDDKNFTFKTSEDGKSTSTGLEFEMKF